MQKRRRFDAPEDKNNGFCKGKKKCFPPAILDEPGSESLFKAPELPIGPEKALNEKGCAKRAKKKGGKEKLFVFCVNFLIPGKGRKT